MHAPADGYNLRDLSTAALELDVRTASPVANVSAQRRVLLGVVLAPSLLLVAGALIGYAGTLDARVALERLIGLLAAGVLSGIAALGLRRVRRPQPVLIATAVVALLGGLWVIAATDPQAQTVLRGPLGAVLLPVVRPLIGSVQLTDPVAVTNTRFIVGYNGLADLSLFAIFCSGAVLLTGAGRRARAVAIALVLIGLVALLATGSRGGLTGLVVGVGAVGLIVWRRRYALLLLAAAPVLAGVIALSILDKGLEFSSTSGRLEYWGDLSRLLVEYPLTGVGLGVSTANRVAVEYELNPDPERIAYAHNTFVQTYLEQGPLGLIGALSVPLLVVGALVRARYVVPERRALYVAGVGLVAALEAHGLTDQVLTTNVGTCLVLLGLAAVLAGLTPVGHAIVGRGLGRGLVVVAGMAVVAGLVVVLVPGGRALAQLNLGSVQLNRALALAPQAPGRASALSDAEATLQAARVEAPEHPAVLRQLARVYAARFDDAAALDALQRASGSSRLDGFDMLQIAHVHRTLGLVEPAYAWASRAYETWERPLDDRILLAYAQGTLADDAGGHRARTLAAQAEAAMRARAFGQATVLFGQALTFAPTNVYLQDRLAGARRGIDRYGVGPTIDLE